MAMRIRRVLPALQHQKLYDSLTSYGWKRAEAGAQAQSIEAVVSTWRHDEVDALVSWVDDKEFSKHFYGLVYGAAADAAVDKLLRDAWLITPERGIASIQEATTTEHLGTAARALGILACGPFNQDVFDVLVGMLTSANPPLQMDALTAMMFSAWPEFAPVLARLSGDDATDAAVRAEAAEVFELQREINWNPEMR